MNESEVKAEPEGSNILRMPWVGLPSVAFNGVADWNVGSAQDDCDKIKGKSEDSSEDLADMPLEIGPSHSSKRSKLNIASAMGFASHLVKATAQSRVLWEPAKKVLEQAGEPVRTLAARLFLRTS